MSTRSAILIKVKDSDLGKKMKFERDKLPVKLQEWNCYNPKEVSEEKSEEVTIGKNYLGIYCHNDGYFDGVGKVLKEVFNDYDKALNLIIGGSCSSVWFDGVRHYANRNGEEWGYIKPIQGDSPYDVYCNIGHNGYVYLFEDGNWSAKDGYEFFDYNEEGII